MPATLVHGDLLAATDVNYIVQQNCCTAMTAHGLSESIATRWPQCNPYADRVRHLRNWATSESRPLPGTIRLMPSSPTTTVVCAFAQYCHGKPGRYHDPLGMDFSPLIANGDGMDMRFGWFKECLETLAGAITPTVEGVKPIVGFPFRIGCGLAGGSWARYEREIGRWSDAHPELDVRVYRLEEE